MLQSTGFFMPSIKHAVARIRKHLFHALPQSRIIVKKWILSEQCFGLLTCALHEL